MLNVSPPLGVFCSEDSGILLTMEEAKPTHMG